MAKKQSTNPTTDNSSSSSNQDALDTVLGYVKEWEEYRQKLLPLWERDSKLYNNERYKKNFKGVANTFVPMTFSTIETIVSAIATGELNTDFIPQDIYKYLKDSLIPGFDPEAESEEVYLSRALANAINGGIIEDESLEVLNALYDYYWDVGDWSIAVAELIHSGAEIGTGSLWMNLKDGRPNLISVPFPDYVFDPLAKDDDSCRFAGRRYLTSIGDLKAEEIADTKTGVRVKRYEALDKFESATVANMSETDKAMQEKLLLGSTATIRKEDGQLKDTDQVEVIELMTKDRMYTLVNRTILAEDEENFIVAQAKLKGLESHKVIPIPGVTWANYKKSSMLVGRSETSTFWQEQERLNDSTNQKSDAVTRALLQNYRADPSLKSQKNSFSVPGAVIWSSANQYEAIPPAQVPGAAFNEETSIKNNIREVTATDQIVKGVGSTKDVTATEAKLQVAGAGQRTEMKIVSLERGPLKRIARLALQYVRLFVSDPFIVPQKASGGIRPLLFNPQKYQYDLEPKVTLTLSAQDQRRQERSEGLETYKLLIEDPTNNLEEIKKIMLPKIVDLDKSEIRRIMTPAAQPEVATAGDPAQAMPPAQQPAMPEGMPV